MSTRSDIIVQRADGTWARIYCHFDGYISGVGAKLQAHWDSQKLADALVAPGDLSALGEIVGVKHPFDGPSYNDEKARKAFDAKYGKMNRYYGRDRGETGCEARTGKTLADVWPPEDTWTEFTYVWTDGLWYVADPDDKDKSLKLLTDAIAADEKGVNVVKSFVKTPFGIIAKRS